MGRKRGCLLLFLAAAALSVWDGVRNGFGFLDFFARFLMVLYAYDKRNPA